MEPALVAFGPGHSWCKIQNGARVCARARARGQTGRRRRRPLYPNARKSCSGFCASAEAACKAEVLVS
eukprot:8901239-Lingulodinium_polyedra.AAC.1